MLDAYTARKAVPRILLAVIAINLSIYLCIAAIDITNIVGRGLNQLLVSPFINEGSFKALEGTDGFKSKGIQIEANVTNSIMGILGVGGFLGAIALSIFGAVGAIASAAVAVLGILLPLIVTVGLIALAVLFTLIIRQGLIIFLTVISPIAFVCYILPGTEKFFKQWADLFVRTLMVYPIIAVIFAMSNVLAVILLSGARGGTAAILTSPASAFQYGLNFAQAESSSGAIGLVQLIVAVLVIYAPLVLIPFAFKLAGGAISAVMNVANGRATSMAGKMNQRIAKSKENPSSFLGKHTNAARTNRLERGATASQFAAGLTGGVRSKRRGDGFRSGYSAYANARGGSALMREKDKLMETDAVKAVMANDDTVAAWNLGNNEAEVRDVLTKRGYHGKDLDEATATVMDAKKQGSAALNKIASWEAQSATGTGFATLDEFNEQLVEASDGNKNVMGRLLAGGRERAIRAGRVEQGIAGYGTHFSNVAALMDGSISREEATANILDSAIDSAPGSQAMQGKPQSAEALAGAWNRRRLLMQNKLAAAEAGGDEGAIKTARQDLTRTMAQIASVQEAMGHSAPQNARVFSNNLMGQELVYKDLSSSEKELYSKAFTKNVARKNADGSEMKDPVTDKVLYDTVTKDRITLAEGFGSIRDNADFQTMRREFGAASDEEIVSQSQRQARDAAEQAREAAEEAEKAARPGG